MNLTLEDAFAKARTAGADVSERTFRRYSEALDLKALPLPRRPRRYPVAEWQRVFDALGLGVIVVSPRPCVRPGRVLSVKAARRAAKHV